MSSPSFESVNTRISRLTGLPLSADAGLLLFLQQLPVPGPFLKEHIMYLESTDDSQTLNILAELKKGLFLSGSTEDWFECTPVFTGRGVQLTFEKHSRINFSLSELEQALRSCETKMEIKGAKLFHRSSVLPRLSLGVRCREAEKILLPRLQQEFGAQNIFSVKVDERSTTLKTAKGYDLTPLRNRFGKRAVQLQFLNIAGADHQLVKVDTVALDRVFSLGLFTQHEQSL